jgi:hypothetical protein
MKHLLPISLFLVFLISCKKEPSISYPGNYMQSVKDALKDSISRNDFVMLDFSKSVLSKVDSIQLYILRVPFKDKNFINDFVVIKTNKAGIIEKGKIIHQEGGAADVDINGGSKKTFNGTISISTLDRTCVLNSPIIDGFITALHSSNTSRTALVQPGNVMPEVVITYVIPSDRDFSWSFWMNLQSYFYDSGSSFGNYYGTNDPNMGGGGSSSGGSNPYPASGGVLFEQPLILIDIESQDETAELDLQKLINCFSTVPNSGAHCSIEILTDIPVDSNPNAVFDLGEKAPGHAFLKLSKHNGTQHVEQYLGFYPKSGYKAFTYAPVASKLSSNAFHEYNASLSMDLTPERLATALIAIQLYSARNYDVDEYNCANFALDVFNSVRGIGLSIPLYGIPGSPLTQASSTPNGLYNKLKQMWDNNDPEKTNMVMGAFKGWAGPNLGCN